MPYMRILRQREFGDLSEAGYLYLRDLIHMAGLGKKYDFHGSFLSKEAAIAREKEIPGSFTQEKFIRGKRRYFVLAELRQKEEY